MKNQPGDLYQSQMGKVNNGGGGGGDDDDD